MEIEEEGAMEDRDREHDLFVGQTEPERNACRPVNNGPTGETEYIFTVPDGRGILHDHGPDFGRAEELLAGMGDCRCADCGGEMDQ